MICNIDHTLSLVSNNLPRMPYASRLRTAQSMCQTLPKKFQVYWLWNISPPTWRRDTCLCFIHPHERPEVL